MGCASSRPTAYPADDDPGVLHKKGSSTLPSPFADGPEFEYVDSRSTQKTGGTPWNSCDAELTALDPTPAPRRLSAHDLEWQLCDEELESRWTVQHLEEIKNLGCAELGVPKCRVSLVSCTHLWIPTRSGAFSPALQVAGAPFQPNFDAFYIEKDASPQIMEDARQDPRCAKHPGVVGRPNLRFFFGAPMLSRGHLVGILYLWESQVRERPAPEKIARLEGLAADAVAALQRSMFRALTPGEERTSYEGVELPTLWIGIFTPKWAVLGGNPAWEALTGVAPAALATCDGLLDAMVPSNEGALVAAVASEAEAAADDPGAAGGLSIPAILSPCAPGGASLQYVLALRPAASPPPGADPRTLPPGSVWVAEVHARVQAVPDEGAAAARRRSISRTALYSTSASSLASSTSYATPMSPPHPPSSPSHSSGGAARAVAALAGGGSGGGGGSRQASGAFLSSASVPATALLGVGPMHIPPRLASLHLGALLGKGSYGSVYEGALEGCPVAVKVMQQAAGPEALDQFWAATYEAMVASDLEHPNLVRTADWCGHADATGGVMWIVQELCDGGSLSKAIKAGRLRAPDGGPDLPAVLLIALEVARGMAYLHSHDVLHGDLSSNNVMLVSVPGAAPDARVIVAKVTDFGLSRAMGGGGAVATKTVGTVSHMPPELLIDGVLAKSGDVYSFGVMLWECLTGRRAWDGSSQAQVIYAITCKNARLEMPGDAPPRYAALMTACMDPDRAARPDFEAVMSMIEGMLGERGGGGGAGGTAPAAAEVQE